MRTGFPQRFSSVRASGNPTQPGSRFAAVRVLPCLITPGNPTDTRWKRGTLTLSSSRAARTASVVAGSGVGTRSRSLIGLPSGLSVCIFRPVPPISMASVIGPSAVLLTSRAIDLQSPNHCHSTSYRVVRTQKVPLCIPPPGLLGQRSFFPFNRLCCYFLFFPYTEAGLFRLLASVLDPLLDGLDRWGKTGGRLAGLP